MDTNFREFFDIGYFVDTSFREFLLFSVMAKSNFTCLKKMNDEKDNDIELAKI